MASIAKNCNEKSHCSAMDFTSYECKGREKMRRQLHSKTQIIGFVFKIKGGRWGGEGLVVFFCCCCCFYLAQELMKGAINLIANKPYKNMALNQLACMK